MEPPPKRLRILQSVDVDEDNADYVRAKQKQQKKLKNAMESIFAKYESMHESMSDIIDMKANKVVVDRGHLRRLQRQVDRNETTLLDTLGLSACQHELEPLEADGKDEGDDGDDADSKEESEDELALTQRPTRHPTASLLPAPPERTLSTPPNPPQMPLTPQPRTESSAATAAGLLQLVQFPQTPAGQQAQTAFYTTLTHTINHAVQQAIAPLFSGLPPLTPSIQWPAMQVAPASAPHVAEHADKVAPASDPKWYFPPLPGESPESLKPRSSSKPYVSHIEIPSMASEKSSDPPVPETRHIPQSSPCRAPVAEAQRKGPSIETPCRQRSPRVVIPSRRSPTPEFFFTQEDDKYIIEKRRKEKLSFEAIRSSREKWRTWPLTTFHLHWDNHLRFRTFYTRELRTRKHAECTTSGEAKHSATQVNHLPTPSSSRHEDHLDEPAELEAGQRNDWVPSNTDCDDDEELELISTSLDNHQEPFTMSDDESQHITPGDVILPSIETAPEVIEELTIQRETSAEYPPILPAIEPNNPPITPTYHSLSPTPHPTPNSRTHVPSPSPNPTTQPHTAPSPPSPLGTPSPNLVDEQDDLLACTSRPPPPRIKRESSNPLPLPSVLCITPARRPKHHLSASKAGAALGPPLGATLFRRRVKQAWTKLGTPGGKAGMEVRAKRAWGGDADGESEDELAM